MSLDPASKSSSLRETLADWTDVDIAEYELARAFGLMGEGVSFSTDAKHVFWSRNPIGTMLYDMLAKLAEVGVLEYRAEPDGQYRWNPNFRGSWENGSSLPPRANAS
jgi:hypothetical protein